MTIWTFDPVKAAALVAIIVSVVQGFKTVLEWLQEHATPGSWWERIWAFWAHSVGPVILAAVVSVVALLPGVVADGGLTLSELWQLITAATGLTAGAAGLYVLLKKLRRPKQPDSTATVAYTPNN